MEQDQKLLHEDTKENKMGIVPIPRLLTGMAFPMVISMLVQACYNVVDSIFVAKIKDDVAAGGSAGTAALNAVGMAFPIQMLLIAFGTGTCVGVNAVLSKALGEKDQKTADRTANNGIFLAFCNFLLFMIVGVFFSESLIRMQGGEGLVLTYGTQYLTIVCACSFGVYTQFILSVCFSLREGRFIA